MICTWVNGICYVICSLYFLFIVLLFGGNVTFHTYFMMCEEYFKLIICAVKEEEVTKVFDWRKFQIKKSNGN